MVADEVRISRSGPKAAKDGSPDRGVDCQDRRRQPERHARAIDLAITDSVGKVKGLVEEVSLASRQRTQGIEQVSRAISQMEKARNDGRDGERRRGGQRKAPAQADSAMGVVERLTALVGVTRARAGGQKTAVRRVAHAAPIVRIGAGRTGQWTPDADNTMSGDATGTYGRF